MNKWLLLLPAALLGACTMGPDYVRPETELPAGWGGPAEETANLAEWWREFDDLRLAALIEEALAHNNDLKAAAANVEAAAAALRLARADSLPALNARARATRTDPSRTGAAAQPAERVTEYDAGLVLDYELDLWGRIRRANEAALAGLHADAAVRDGVRAGVAAAVARAYFESLALERRVALLERLHETRTEDLRLQARRLDAGLISPYDYQQARSETAAVAAQLPLLHSARRQVLTALSVLRGASPGAIFAEWQTGGAAGELPEAPAVPMGLPSALLERRPDVRAAEQRLILTNARIGEAKAAYFPRLSLTGFAGGVSTAFSGLFDEPSQFRQGQASLFQPLTDFNRAGARVNAATARRRAAAAEYAKTVQQAFRETLNALDELSAARAVMRAQDERVDALGEAYRVVEARYRAGRSGYLELLDVERQLRDVEQRQVEARLSLLNATVDLYRALGGGWPADGIVAGRGEDGRDAS